MAINLTEEEASILSRMAYMNLDMSKGPCGGFEGKSLKEVATKLLADKEAAEAAKVNPWDFGAWGNLTNTEQYAMLEKIRDGKYKNLSNLELKAYNNQENTTGFVGYAFRDGNNHNNTVCAFRGTQGNQVGDDGFVRTADGMTNKTWIDNGYMGTRGSSLEFEPTKNFMKANMVPGGETFVTGHSKGGGNAVYACATFDGVTGIAFDAPGLGQALDHQERARVNAAKFYNVVDEDCPVGALEFHPEERTYSKKHPFNVRNREGDEIAPATSITAAHSLQANKYNEDGTAIRADRSGVSMVVEDATQDLYVANRLTEDPLGSLVDKVQTVKRLYNAQVAANEGDDSAESKKNELNNDIAKIKSEAKNLNLKEMQQLIEDCDKASGNEILHSAVKGAIKLRNAETDLVNSTVAGATKLKNAGVDLANSVEAGAANLKNAGVDLANSAVDRATNLRNTGLDLANSVAKTMVTGAGNLADNSTIDTQQTEAASSQSTDSNPKQTSSTDFWQSKPTTVQVTVLPNDSVEKIADAMGTTPDKITDKFGQRVYTCNPNTVVNVETHLGMSGDVVYKVQPGDDWGTISKRTGVPYDELRANNKNVGEGFNPGMTINYPKHQLLDAQVINNTTGKSQGNPDFQYNTSALSQQTKTTIIPIKVLPGDSLVGIANAFNTTPEKLTDGKGQQVYSCNGDTVIYAEVHLGIDGNVQYQAQPGDDWGKIAQRTGVSYDELRAVNPNLREGFNQGVIIHAPRAQTQIDFLDGIKPPPNPANQGASSPQRNFNQQLNLRGSQKTTNQFFAQPGIGGDAEDPKMWAEREKAIREHTSLKNDNKDATEEYYKQAKNLLVKEGGWSQNLDAAIAQTMLKQKYEEKQIMDAMKSISPCVPGALDERAQDYANGIMKTVTPDVDSVVQTSTPTKIGDLRKTLNGQMDEINKQLKELNQERRQMEGAPLSKEQAEKLVASNHLNGADKELDKQAQELQAKRDKLSQYEKDNIAFGKEHSLDTTLWRHAPEIFKGEGLKHYEGAMATVENNTKVYDRQAAEIQAKRDEHQARLQTPEAKSEIAKKSEEILAQDKERLAKLGALDQKQNELTNEKRDIIKLKDIIPSRKLEQTIDVQGDAKDVKNLLGQSDQIKQQVADLQPAQVQSRGRSM
jgi:LysM repeat protein